MTAILEQFLAWQVAARAGDRFEYYRGFLASDYDLSLSARFNRDDIRAEAARLYMTGEYELAQTRVGGLREPGSIFAYFIIKRRSRDTTPRPSWKQRTETEIFRAGKPHSRRAA